MSRKSVQQLMAQLLNKTQEAILLSSRPNNLISFDEALNELTLELNNTDRTSFERMEIYVKMRKFQKMLRATECIFLSSPYHASRMADDGASTSTAPCTWCETNSHSH